ncbi:hypothetical protein P7M41_26650, partial [Vibrio parahaemolyticus]|nr:hypothetical protein [Vibrio parahaemolyticus]
MEPAITLLFTASLLVNATSSFRVSGMLCPLTFFFFPFSQYIGLLYTSVDMDDYQNMSRSREGGLVGYRWNLELENIFIKIF